MQDFRKMWILVLVHSLLALLSCTKALGFPSNETLRNRNLQAKYRDGDRDQLRSLAKREKLQKFVRQVMKNSPPGSFKIDDDSPPHNPQGPAIFAAAMEFGADRTDAIMFVGTARKAGYTGDIVLAIFPDANKQFVEALKEWEVIIYTVHPDCVGVRFEKTCSFPGHDVKVSINMIRFYMYQWWAQKYDTSALIMFSDFRDVFFQANPFTYRTFEWAPPVSQLVVFQEAYPNKVIYRCIFNGGWIETCYGSEGLKRVGSNIVSCSGVTMGTRDAMMAYANLVTQQLDPRVRYGRNTTKTNKGCISTGMDQGFHNWLVYSGQLNKYMDVKIFPQGEGPVNTLGAFFGERAVLKMSLEQWRITRGVAPNKYVHNWNGDISPVVHQADRFLDTELKPNYKAHLAVAAIT